MSARGPHHDRPQRGFTLLELMIVVLILGLLASIAVPAVRNALDKAKRNALVADAQELHEALMRYHADVGRFPAMGGPPETSFNPLTLTPLSNNGYFTAVRSFNNKLWRGQVLVYIPIAVGGTYSEYLILMRLKQDPSGFVLVAHTGILPASWGSDWYDGVYVYHEGDFVRPDQAD